MIYMNWFVCFWEKCSYLCLYLFYKVNMEWSFVKWDFVLVILIVIMFIIECDWMC